MFCKQCGNEILESAVVCIKCGVATGQSISNRINPKNRNRTTFILLGVLLGIIGFPGIHNFYAGYSGKGIAQLLMTVLSCWILWIPALIWTIIEVCTITHDADGCLFN